MLHYESICCCQWSLVCDKAGLTELSQTVIFAGQALGSALTSSLADRYGRRKLYIVCLLGVAAGMFSISFVDNYPLSLFCRVVTGFCQTVGIIYFCCACIQREQVNVRTAGITVVSTAISSNRQKN